MENVQAAAQQISRSLLQQKEELIREAINHVIGREWHFDEIIDRCRHMIKGSGKEVYFFDGVPVLEFGRPSFSVVEENQSKRVFAKVNCKKLYCADEAGVCA